jgi:ATP-dependent Clp protease ATP-binding subunit ClpA
MRLASLTTLLAALALALASGGLDAQAKKVGKMYKWTDKEGNVHYSDQIPPEAVEYGREKFNDQGMTVETVDRAPTPEELVAQREAERLAAEEARRAEEQKKLDETLIASYASEEDLVRAYEQRMDLLEQTIEARRIEIGAREQSLSKLVAQAADLERGGRPVSDALRQMITSEQNEISRQRTFLETKDKERSQIKVDHERQLARFREAMARSKGR